MSKDTVQQRMKIYAIQTISIILEGMDGIRCLIPEKLSICSNSGDLFIFTGWQCVDRPAQIAQIQQQTSFDIFHNISCNLLFLDGIVIVCHGSTSCFVFFWGICPDGVIVSV